MAIGIGHYVVQLVGSWIQELGSHCIIGGLCVQLMVQCV